MWHLYIGVICAVLISATCAIMYARCAREERERVRQGLPPRWDGSLVGEFPGRLVTSTPVASRRGAADPSISSTRKHIRTHPLARSPSAFP